MARVLEVVDRLRGEHGCPWDREQTLESLKPYLVEETYELLDAVDSQQTERHLEELGDVLLQIALHARIRKEEQKFSFADVAEALAEKLVRRHPHVFGDTTVSDSGEVLRNWEAIKSEEKTGQRRSAIGGIPRHLPALHKAQRVQSRASRVGFDWARPADVVDKVEEELGELKEALATGNDARVRDEIGDLLFAVVNLSRLQKVRAEDALSATTAKFIRRFQEVEHRLQTKGRKLQDCSLEEMDAEWDAVKLAERAGG